VRDYCPLVYRRWTGAGFDYSEATCPYAGAQSYDLDGNPVPNSMDKPSKRLGTCCRVRFGVNAALPFGGFPGVARVRAR
jgi:phage-related protein